MQIKYWKGEGSSMTVWNTVCQPCNHLASLLSITSQSSCCHMLNTAFDEMLSSRASYPECIFSTIGLSRKWASHLHRISAMINLSTAFFFSEEDRKWLGLYRAVICVISQHKQLTSPHQACGEQPQLVTTSDSWKAIKMYLSSVNKLYTRG